ncbi:MAG: 1-deoxy-D-xylulose-5-phosphate synthase N-terminal domain-containing protein, partial [Victivallaceae bacterium]|nr:1-deoxy-D-xylulose-5-phosphate synthase N-terminal domain-containing protein [Victivallaceae bacterium]
MSLEKIASPEDLKKLSLPELESLAGELRSQIIHTVGKNGGHLASSLGAVELALAIHTVFDTPHDAVVWDVGHQAYAHKILTGRGRDFETLRKFDGLSGFPNPAESVFDPMIAGHAGTAVSSAMGLAAVDRNRKVVAVVGDGALGCGLTLEALNNVSEKDRNLIVIVNDNKMSIAPNKGALRTHLNNLVTNYRFNRFKSRIKGVLRRIPWHEALFGFIRRMESVIKHTILPESDFEFFDLRYVGPFDGNRLDDLLPILHRLRALD